MARAMLANMKKPSGTDRFGRNRAASRAPSTAGRPSTATPGGRSGQASQIGPGPPPVNDGSVPGLWRRAASVIISRLLEGLPMRTFGFTVAGVLAALSCAALAQNAPAPAQPPAAADAAAAKTDPVVARVDGA